MKTRLYIPLVLIVLPIIAACSKSTSEPETLTIEDLLVRNSELAGWVYGDRRWVARNFTELYGAIDGAGDVMNRYGFREAASQNYNGTVNDAPCVVTLMVFDQTTDENAGNLYDDPDTGMSDAIPWPDGAGEDAQYKINEGFSAKVTFYRSNYYVDLDIFNGGSEEGLNILKQFALNVDGKILDNE
jgi:hypothetical protein